MILNKKRVAVALSGGVDSAIAAVLLKKQGYEVSGLFMKLWAPAGNHYWQSAVRQARQVARSLDINLRVVDLRLAFKKIIVDDFLKQYQQGLTPNPCVRCNQKIKFGLLLKAARRLRADYLATGHYVRLKVVGQGNKKTYQLLTAKDKTKDQSYFLWTLNQKQLTHLLFPLGNYLKKDVRKMAQQLGFTKLTIQRESQEICFVPRNTENPKTQKPKNSKTLSGFLKKHLKLKSGPIVDLTGRKIGQHRGLPLYTIGQRKGVEIGGTGPYYVVAKNYRQNTLVVSNYFASPELFNQELIARQVNWVRGTAPRLPLKIKAKIRYGHPARTAAIYPLTKQSVKVVFAQKQRAITPGQSAVFYRRKEVLGGGIIA